MTTGAAQSMNRQVAGGAALVLALLCTLSSSTAHAGVSYELTVRVDVDRRSLSGQARITFTNDSASALPQVLLWCYPDRFAVRPAALNDYNRYWIYPYRFNPASLIETPKVTLWVVAAEGGRRGRPPKSRNGLM